MSSNLSLEDAETAARHILKAHHYGGVLVEGLKEVLQEHGLSGDSNWMPDFGGSTHQSNGDWTLVFVKTDDESARTEVQVGSSKGKLLEALTYLKEQSDSIASAFESDPTSGLMRPKQGAPEAEVKKGAFSLNNIKVITDIIKSKEVLDELNRDVSLAMDALTWMSVNKVTKLASVLWKSHKGFVMAAHEGFTASKGGAAFGTLVSGVFLAFDAYGLAKAIRSGDKTEVAAAATAVTSDIVSTALGITGSIAGIFAGETAAIVGTAATVSAFASALAVPLAGITIGVGALVQQAMYNVKSAEQALHYLGLIFRAYQNKGYSLNEDSVMIPNVDANIFRLNFRTGQLEFGETRLMGNKSSFSTPLQETNRWVNFRAETGASDAVIGFNDGGKDKVVVVLPQGGDLTLTYGKTYTFANFGWRKDWELGMLKPLQRKNLFRFSNYTWAVSDIKYENHDKSVWVTLDSRKSITMVLPPNNAYRRGNSWKLVYELTGNGGEYALVTSSKPDGPVEVYITEDGSKTSNWMIQAGEGESDSFTDVRASGFYFGNVWIGVNTPHLSNIVVMSNSVLYKFENGKKTLIGVNKVWLDRQENLFQSLAALAKEQGVTQMLVSGLFLEPGNNSLWFKDPPSSSYIAVSGVYNAETKEMRVYVPKEGRIYLCTSQYMACTFWGVDADWINKNGGTDLFKNLANCARGDDGKVHLENVQIPTIGKRLSGVYSKKDDAIMGASEDGSIFRISRDLSAQLVALALDKEIPLDAIKNRISGPDLLGILGPTIIGLPRQHSATLGPIITIFGLPYTLWYISGEGSFVRGAKDSSYVGQVDGLHILQLGNKLYSQTAGKPEVAPVEPKQIFGALGAIKDAFFSGTTVLITTNEDLYLKVLSVKGKESAELFKTGDHCGLSWDTIFERSGKGDFQLGEIIYSMSPAYWYHTPTKTKFNPTGDIMGTDKDIGDYLYLGYQAAKARWNKAAIYLFNKAHNMIFALSPDGAILSRAAKDAFRIGKVLAIEGHAWEQDWSPAAQQFHFPAFRPHFGGIHHPMPFPEPDPFPLPSQDPPSDLHQMGIDDVQTLILRVIPDSYPTLAWPNELGFPKTLFETPEDKEVASSIKVQVPNDTASQKVNGNDLELKSGSRTLVFADVAGNTAIYDGLQVDFGSGRQRNVSGVFQSGNP